MNSSDTTKPEDVRRLASEIKKTAENAHRIESVKQENLIATPLYSAELALDVYPNTNDARIREVYNSLKQARAMAKEREKDTLYRDISDLADEFTDIFPEYSNPSGEKK